MPYFHYIIYIIYIYIYDKGTFHEQPCNMDSRPLRTRGFDELSTESALPELTDNDVRDLENAPFQLTDSDDELVINACLLA